jgi:alpha-mannosidase
MLDKSKDPSLIAPEPSRRDFLANGLAAFLAAALPAKLSAQQTGSRPVLHIIGHSHIDAAWLWPWTDSANLVLTTFRSALDRMLEAPGFRYSHSSAIHYKWVQDADPKMFQEILGRIREGRWEVVGGWPVEPDCNLPSTESFARHCLYGNRYCHEQLHVDVKIGFNPDSFGHAAGIPTVLKNAGYKYYVFMRPQLREMELPNLFWWEGPDASRILTYRIMGHYDSNADRARAAHDQLFPTGSTHGALFLGVGDHGGSVTKEQIRQILEMQKDPKLPELRWSTVQEFFTSIETTMDVSKLPVIRGDLQHHSRGCYSANGEQKFLNRHTEQQLFNTESIATVASLAYGRAYPTPRLADAWNHLLFNQFHDVLAGTSLYSDYQDVRDGIGYACQIATEEALQSLEIMAKAVDLHDVPASAVFAFNPLPWPRRALLEYRFQNQTADQKAHQNTHLKSKDGAIVPVQIRPSDSMSGFFPRLSAWVDLPACGYKVFTVEQDQPQPKGVFPGFLTISKEKFGLSSFRADDGRELLAGNLGLVVIEDNSDTWAHDVASFRKELGRPELLSTAIVEDGPILRVTRQRSKWRNSTITMDIFEHAGATAIEFRFVIDWNEKEQILKFEVPTRFPTPAVIAKVPGAVLQRLPNGNEEPYQDWIALQGTVAGRDYTLALINNSTYSYDCLDGLLRTILIRSAPYARHNPYPTEVDGINAWQDQGRQERAFWLVRDAGPFTALSLDRRAKELQTPAQYVTDSRHAGTEPWEKSMFAVSPAGVEVLSLKHSEDGTAIIVRVQERDGKNTVAMIESAAIGLKLELHLTPWEIRTIRISHRARQRAAVAPSNIMERA